MVALATAFVRLRPETVGFKKDAEAKLKSVNVTAKVRLTPDTKGFQTLATAAVRKAKVTASVGLAVNGKGLSASINNTVKNAGGQAAAKAKGRSISQAFSEGFESGGSTFGKVAATMAARATIAASAVAAATPAVAQFVAALAPAAGVGAALPAVLTAIKVTSLTAKIAVIGVGDAISSGFSGNSKKAAEDLKQLHGATRVFTREVIALRPQLTGIQQLTAQRFFAPLVNEVKPLAKVFLPALRTELPQTGKALGNVAEQVAHVARQGPAVRALNAVFNQSQGALVRIKAAIGPVVNGIANGLVATAPFVGQLAGYFTTLAIRVGNFLTQAAKTGQLAGWIRQGIVTVKNLIAIFVNLGAITSAVFQQATGSSGNLLVKIRDLTGQARRFVESAQGGQVIADLFKTMGVFGEALRKSLAGVLPQIATSLQMAAPAAGQFATAVSNVIVQLGPLLPALTGVSVKLLTAVIPALNSFAGWLGRNQGLLQAIAPVILGYVVAAKAVAVATTAATIATRAWAVVMGVAKVAQAGWTAATWLARAPVVAYNAAMRLSTSTVGTWIGVKRIEAVEWIKGAAAAAKDTAAKVANRVATVASAAATKASAAASAVGAWLANTGAVIANTAASVANRVAVVATSLASKVAAGAQLAYTAAMAASTAVMSGVRAGVLAINAAMRANPIGAVITVIGLLVGALIILYQRNETVRRIIDLVWAKIKVAIGVVVDWFVGTALPWLKGALDRLVAGFQFLWAWVQRIWGWIRTFIAAAIQATLLIFNTLKNFVTKTIPAAFNLLVNLVRTSIQGWRMIIAAGVDYVRGRFQLAKDFVTKTIPAAFTFMVNLVKTSINGWRSLISAGWEYVKSKLQAAKDYVTKTLPDAFRNGVSAIGKAWEGIREAAKKPVNFVINSVINPLIGGFNKIAGVFGAPKVDKLPGLAEGGKVRKNLRVPGYARGGRIPGAPSSVDNIMGQMTDRAGRMLGPLKVATGEFIVNARDTAKALPLLQWVNSGMRGGPDKAAQYIGRRPVREPGDGSEGWAFAKGGLVGFISNVWDAVSDPSKLIKAPVERAINAIPGSGMFRDVIVGLGHKLLDGLLGFVKKNNASGGGHWDGKIAGGNVGNVQKFIQAQAGKPYVWASAGPGGYDCSGIVSAAYNLLKGRNPYSHTFSTESAGSFFRPGTVGPLMAGWSHPGQRPASASVGHMAGQIGGMPFESTGSKGVRVGNGTRRIGQFAQRGAAFAGGGMVDSGPVRLLDRGGRWPSGTLAANLSGHTEHVMTGGPGGDISELKELLAAILAVLTGLGGEVADALERPTRRAVQLGRGRGTNAAGRSL